MKLLERYFDYINEIDYDLKQEDFKNILFKIAECNYKPSNPDLWPKLKLFPDNERYDKSSIFAEKHL